MKRVTLNRNGQIHAKAREESDLKAGQFEVGQHVMLRITGDCCYHSGEYAEYVVAKIEPCDRFGGGRETVTFDRVDKKEEVKKVKDEGEGEERNLTSLRGRDAPAPLGITTTVDGKEFKEVR